VSEHDASPFPVPPYRDSKGRPIPKSAIPRWMAQIIWARLRTIHGPIPELEQFAEKGGFSASTILSVLAGGDGTAECRAFMDMLNRLPDRSIKSGLQIVTAGTKGHREMMKELESELKEAARKRGRIVFGPGGASGDGQAGK
jgi:hypothetical protein